MRFQLEDAMAEFADGILTLAAGKMVRRINFTAGAPRTEALTLNGRELATASDRFDAEITGLTLPGASESEPLKAFGLQVTDVRLGAAPEYDGVAVQAEISTFETRRRITRIYRYLLYPGLPAVAMELELVSAVVPLRFWHVRHAAAFNAQRQMPEAEPTVVDRVRWRGALSAMRAIEFRLRTDYSNELLLEHTTETAAGHYKGNLLFGAAGDVGFFYLQEAPPAVERRDLEAFDFRVAADGTVESTGSGLTAADIVPGERLKTARHVLGFGDAETAKRYQAARLGKIRATAYAVTVNPWGSGGFYERVNAEFIADELTAAAACGAELYQVDDGWQQGGVLADIAIHNQWVDREFWRIDPVKFPAALTPLAALARKLGVGLSLWFAPGCNREFADWEESAEILLGFYREYGITVFKLDGVLFTSCRAETNFRRLLERLNTASSGAITVNLDVTNGLRGGLLMLTEFGSAFLENRYVCHSWAKEPYHPVNTLKNLWRLSRYVRTQSLQIEVPSPEEINPASYDRPERPALPSSYDYEFWLGVALFANMLLWFMPSRQSPALRATTAKLVRLHREHRAALFSGAIRPIGGTPGDGELTGFYAESGYAIAYRTLTAAESGSLFPAQRRPAQLLYATGDATLETDGTTTLRRPGSFAFWKLDV